MTEIRTILVIGSDVTSDEYQRFRRTLHRRHIEPRVVRATLDSAEVVIGDQEFSLNPDPDPDGTLSHAQIYNLLRAEEFALKQRFARTLGALDPVAMVVMKEGTWLTWGEGLSSVPHMFKDALQYTYPYAQRYVLHPQGSRMKLETV